METTGRTRTHPRRREDLLVEPVGDDLLVLDPASEAMYELNDTAGVVLELCDGTRTVDEITAWLLTHFQVPEADRIGEDVALTVDRLGELGLLVDGDAP